MITIKCSHCPTIIGYKEGGDGVSHGVCPKCLEEQNRLLEEMIEEQKKEGKKNGQK